MANSSSHSLELLLLQVLMPDNEARRQAEDQIKRLSKDPQVIPALVHHLRTAKTPNVRQLAAILLRKKIAGHWAKLLPQLRSSIKSALIDSITSEHRFVFCLWIKKNCRCLIIACRIVRLKMTLYIILESLTRWFFLSYIFLDYLGYLKSNQVDLGLIFTNYYHVMWCMPNSSRVRSLEKIMWNGKIRTTRLIHPRSDWSLVNNVAGSITLQIYGMFLLTFLHLNILKIILVISLTIQAFTTDYLFILILYIYIFFKSYHSM